MPTNVQNQHNQAPAPSKLKQAATAGAVLLAGLGVAKAYENVTEPDPTVEKFSTYQLAEEYTDPENPNYAAHQDEKVVLVQIQDGWRAETLAGSIADDGMFEDVRDEIIGQTGEHLNPGETVVLRYRDLNVNNLQLDSAHTTPAEAIQGQGFPYVEPVEYGQ